MAHGRRYKLPSHFARTLCLHRASFNSRYLLPHPKIFKRLDPCTSHLNISTVLTVPQPNKLSLATSSAQNAFYSLSSVQLLSHVQLLAIPWTAAHQASLSITNSQSLLKFMSIELVMPSNHLILCRPLILLPSIFPKIRVSYNVPVLCIRWPKYWSFSFSISLSSEHSGLISFRINWFDLLAVQGTLKSLFQHHS